MQSKNVSKSGKNAYTKFAYLELSDFLPQTNAIFESLGLIGLFNMGEGKATLTVQNAENSEERVVFDTPIPNPQDFSKNGSNPAQALGSLHTYFRRYLYTNALELAVKDTIDDKDPNQPQAKKSYTPPQPQKEQPQATPQAKTWDKMCSDLKDLFAEFPEFKNSPIKIAGFVQDIRDSNELTYQQKMKLLKRIDQEYELDNATKFEKDGR